MLDKALQQPDGKISEQVLYTEEDMKQAIYQAISYPETFVTGICCDNSKINDWIKQYKKH